MPKSTPKSSHNQFTRQPTHLTRATDETRGRKRMQEKLGRQKAPSHKNCFGQLIQAEADCTCNKVRRHKYVRIRKKAAVRHGGLLVSACNQQGHPELPEGRYASPGPPRVTSITFVFSPHTSLIKINFFLQAKDILCWSRLFRANLREDTNNLHFGWESYGFNKVSDGPK